MLRRLKNFLQRRRLPTFEPTQIDDISIQCYAQWPVGNQLISRWNTLTDSIPSATPFQTPEWQSAAWHALTGERTLSDFPPPGTPAEGQRGGRLSTPSGDGPRISPSTGNPGEGRGGGFTDNIKRSERSQTRSNLRLFTFERNNQLLGILPTHFDRQGTLTTIAPGLTDYLDPLFIEPQTILKCLLTIQKNVTSSVTFCNIRESCPLRTELPRIAPSLGFEYREKITEYTPAITFPKTWDDYLAMLDPHERKELRRKINKAQREAHARLEPTVIPHPGVATSVATIPELTTALTFMESNRPDKASATHQYLAPLLKQAAPPLITRNKLDLLTLYLNDKPACCLFQFRHPTGPMLYNIGYDPATKQWSPGQVAIGLAIQQAIAQGFPTYDMLRGQEPYKYRLGAIDRPLFQITLTQPF